VLVSRPCAITSVVACSRRPIGATQVNAVYSNETIDLLRAVKTAQRLGLTLVEIEEILRLSTPRVTGSNPLQDRMREKGPRD
jgi:MerR HTH family regulatory protein